MSTIYEKAILCKISISQFNPKRQDAKTTSEVLREKNARREAGNWMKNLVDPKALDGVTRSAQKARNRSYEITSPWTDEGWRILPIELYFEYQSEMNKLKQEFENEVEKFLVEWPNHVATAKKNLNGMFDEKNYPSIEILRRKFAFGVDIVPIPSGNDFRVSLSDEELERIKKETNEMVFNAEKNAIKNLWERLAEPVSKMVDKLKDDESIFRNSLVENLVDILNLIPALNLWEDENLKNFVEECKSKLTIYTADDLREQEKARKTVLKNAEDILNRMKGYF